MSERRRDRATDVVLRPWALLLASLLIMAIAMYGAWRSTRDSHWGTVGEWFGGAVTAMALLIALAGFIRERETEQSRRGGEDDRR